MIKLIILDVDGVLLGTKKGINSPYPSQKVIEFLKKEQDLGVPVSLCTGKASFATKLLIDQMQLNNLHITDGGAVIFNPIDNIVLESITLPIEPIKKLLQETKSHNTFWELYTLNNWFIHSNSEKKYAIKHQESSNIVPWKEVDDLLVLAKTEKLTKAMILFPQDLEDFYKNIFSKYEDVLALQWTYAPALLPNKLLIITAKAIDKRSSVTKLIKQYNLKPDETLAVGDTMMDWKFMDGCGYIAAMGNADSEMKGIINGRGGFVGGDVDEDGIIDIIEHFKQQIEYSK